MEPSLPDPAIHSLVAAGASLIVMTDEGAYAGRRLFDVASGEILARVAAGERELAEDLLGMLAVFREEGAVILNVGFRMHTEGGATMEDCAIYDRVAKREYLHFIREFFSGTLDDWRREANGREADAFAAVTEHLDAILAIEVFPDDVQRGRKQRMRIRDFGRELIRRVTQGSGRSVDYWAANDH